MRKTIRSVSVRLILLLFAQGPACAASLARSVPGDAPAGVAALPVAPVRPSLGALGGLRLSASLSLSHSPLVCVPALAAPAAPRLSLAAAAPVADAPVRAAPQPALSTLQSVSGKLGADSKSSPASLLGQLFDRGGRQVPSLSVVDAGAPITRRFNGDEIIHHLWQAGQRARKKPVRIGAIVVDGNGRILGAGENRTSTPEERKLVHVGLIIHAEQVAVAQALRTLTKELGSLAKAQEALKGAHVYAMGVSKDGTLYARKIRAIFACKVCAHTLERFHLNAVGLSAHGFKEFLWNEVVGMAKANGKHRWWQNLRKQDPNVRWLPISAVEKRLQGAGSRRRSGSPRP